jgi:hypothetical protein
MRYRNNKQIKKEKKNRHKCSKQEIKTAAEYHLKQETGQRSLTDQN